MLIEQIEIELKEPQYIAREIPFGEVFLYKGDVHMRVKPVSFLLNSTLVQENINAGKVFCVNMEKGTLHIIQGGYAVERIEANLTWRK